MRQKAPYEELQKYIKSNMSLPFKDIHNPHPNYVFIIITPNQFWISPVEQTLSSILKQCMPVELSLYQDPLTSPRIPHGLSVYATPEVCNERW